MFKVKWFGRPQPAERPRTRLRKDKKSFYIYTPPTYEEYKENLKLFFSSFKEDKSYKEIFDKKKIVYGLSVKIISRFKTGNANIFYALRPDIDNIYKAIVDGLFESDGNLYENGVLKDKQGNTIVDAEGKALIKYSKKIDDCRVVHMEVLKIKVDTEEEESFTLIVRNVGKEDIT